MCNVDDSDLVDGMRRMPTTTPNDTSECKKCRSQKALLSLRVRDHYCRDCFIAMSVHKFRATLGKNKVMKPGDRVAVAFDGTSAGLALLKLLRLGSDETLHKRTILHPVVVIVDTFAAFPEQEGVRRHDRLRSLRGLTKLFGFPVVMCPLEKAIYPNVRITYMSDDEDDDDEYETPPEISSHEISSLLSSMSDTSAKEDLFRTLVQRAVALAAADMEVSKVFTSESATSLAVKLMSGIASGRGKQLSLDCGLIDGRLTDVTFIRPLREFSKKEIVLFTVHSGLPPAEIKPTYSAKQESMFSIRKLTEDFVVGLQEDFPATVPTICRTGDKLHLTCTDMEQPRCLLCHGLMDTSEEKPCSLTALRFSETISCTVPKDFAENEDMLNAFRKKLKVRRERTAPRNGCQNLGACSAKSNSDEVSCCQTPSAFREARAVLENCLCYSCCFTVARMKTIPEFLSAQAERVVKRRLMKEEIKDFLL